MRPESFRLLRWYGRLANWLHPGELEATLLWAAVVGGLAGLGGIAFRAAIQGVLWCWTRHTGSLEQVAAQIRWWQRLWIPVAGGLLGGLVLHFGARFGRGHTSTDYMEAVAVRRGTISLRQGLMKILSSLMTIGSGGSIGREGAMVQLSATVASWLGQRGRLSTPRLRLVVACGAAGGIAAVYNVTIAAALFVAEIVLGSIAMESLGPLLVAAVASALVSRYLGGAEAYFTSPPFRLASAWEILPFVAVGLALGVAAPGYVWLLHRAQDVFRKLAPQVYVRLALGGVVVGALAIAFPEVWGNGRTMVNLSLQNPWPWTVLAAILVVKVVATAATTGSGAVGGVFTPTMFTGAMLGCLLGHAVQALWPGATSGPQAYALVGMGGFLAAVTRAPLMAMLMLFEMTLDYGVVLPLMVVSVLAYFTARSLRGDSIYSESLRRKQPALSPAGISALLVRDLIKPPHATVREDAPFPEIARLFAAAPYRHLPVVSPQNQLRGMITLREIEDQIQHPSAGNAVTASSLMWTDLEMVTPETRLSDALEVFRRYEGERLPVVNDPRQRVLLGYISKTDVLLTMAHGLHGGPVRMD
ncbi:MAG TPA: ClcB-like voltage-gated chloride channel protein [Candidatus Acidoferrum sp.]|nr:ClcB-like voltage-gated chloride channel protein [Candidatus Acidoferrum sp.]